eukprot:gene33764-40853_t
MRIKTVLMGGEWGGSDAGEGGLLIENIGKKALMPGGLRPRGTLLITSHTKKEKAEDSGLKMYAKQSPEKKPCC